MKKFVNVLAVLAITLIATLAFTACSGVDEISVEKAPQVTYVVGQELNLAEGKLLVKSGDKTESISMADGEVSISGFDANKKGTQTLTVTYKKKSTQLDVKVVDRMQAENYTYDYFVGDEFNNAAGRIRITRNDGTSYTIAMSDEKLYYGDIDASQAGPSEVTVDYVNGSTEYSGVVEIYVHEIENIKFYKPTKISYCTHDDGIDLSGGYLTLEGNNGKLEKDIPLTDVAVTGFDLSKATKENKANPLSQTVTIGYAGNVFNYDIKITYTDVKEIQANAAVFMDYDFTGVELPTISDEDGELAIETMQMYSEMLSAHQAIITDDELVAIARTAAAYGFGKWLNDINNYENAFVFDANSGLAITAYDKDLLRADLAKLNNPNRDFYVYGDALTSIVELCEEATLGYALSVYVAEVFYGIPYSEEFETIYETLTFADLPVYDPDDFRAEILSVLQFMIDLSEKVPADCTVDNVASYKTQLDATYSFIAESNYLNLSYASVYASVSAWRANNDLEDILFTHLYNEENYEGMNTLASVMLPSVLTNMYNVVFEGMDYMAYMEQDPMSAMSSGYMFMDATGFLALYYYVLGEEEAVRAGEYGDMCKYFYDNVSVNGFLGANDGNIYTFTSLLDELKYGQGGYCSIVGANIGIKESEALLKKYVDLYEKYASSTSFATTAEYKAGVESIFADFMAMSPAVQSGFISMLNVYYEYGIPSISFNTITDRELLENMLGDTLENALAGMGYEGVDPEEIFGEGLDEPFFVTAFAEMIITYYKSVLTTAELDKTFHNLVRAIEYYSLTNSYADAFENFENYLGLVTTALTTDALTAAEKEEFNSYFGALYNKYVDVAAVKADGYVAVDLGDLADDFAKLEEAGQYALDTFAAVQGGQISFSAFFIACEKVFAVSDYILSKANEDVLFAYNHEFSIEYKYIEYDEEGNSTNLTYTYTADGYVGHVRMAYNYILTGSSLHDTFTEELKQFMVDVYSVTYEYDEQTGFAQADILSIMNDFDALTSDDKLMFYILDLYSGSEYPYYLLAVTGYWAEEMSEAPMNVVYGMLVSLDLDVAYYESDPTDANLLYLTESLAEVTTAYDALTDEEKEEFKVVKEIYDSIVARAEALIADADEE